MIFSARNSIKRMRRMLEAIRTGDFTLRVSTDNLHGEERRLAEDINNAIHEQRIKEATKEAELDYFRAMLNRVETFIIVADDEGTVKWMNEQAITGLCGFRVPNLSHLKVVNPDLTDYLNSLNSGDQRLVNLHINDHEVQLKLSMVRYTLKGVNLRLFTLENVQYVLQQSEMEVQKRLISVLTHEIMNSLSPIISLSESLCNSMSSEDHIVDDTELQALRTINRRSQGLLNFVDNYRKLSRLPKPVCQWTRIGEIVDTVKDLYPNDYITYTVEDQLIQLSIDRQQMEQVLINLVKNAIEATEGVDNPEIVVSTHADHSNRQFIITVTDNGVGFSPESIDSIFLPFFTTKPNGSGIGLSLSLQIMIQHRGFIKVKRSTDHTIFEIVLPLYYRIDNK